MKLQVKGAITHVATGGKEFDSSLPTVLFLHGSGLDHRSFALQTRWFAYNGFSVLAPDFPGHSLSAGEPINTIEDSAIWLNEFLDAAKVERAHVIGHSQGFLSAMELARSHPEKIASLIGVGTATAIPVNPALIETANKSTIKAAEMMLQWGFGNTTHLGVSPTPGMQPIAVGLKIMANNPLAEDLQSCADYVHGNSAAEKIEALNIPCAMVLAGKDKMTPLKAGKVAAQALNAQVTIIEENGHMLPIEAPKRVLHAIRRFILAQAA